MALIFSCNSQQETNKFPKISKYSLQLKWTFWRSPNSHESVNIYYYYSYSVFYAIAKWNRDYSSFGIPYCSCNLSYHYWNHNSNQTHSQQLDKLCKNHIWKIDVFKVQLNWIVFIYFCSTHKGADKDKRSGLVKWWITLHHFLDSDLQIEALEYSDYSFVVGTVTQCVSFAIEVISKSD